MKRHVGGFQLIELMAVVAIVAIIAVVMMPNLSRFVTKAKRLEAYANLRSLCMAQKAYFAEHGSYAQALSGPQSAGWKPDGYKNGGSNESFNYTYGFSSGGEGTHYFTGKQNTSASALAGSGATSTGFKACAACTLGTGKTDVLSINEQGVIKVEQDGLAD